MRTKSPAKLERSCHCHPRKLKFKPKHLSEGSVSRPEANLRTEAESRIGSIQADSKYERLIAQARAVPPATTIVVHPCDETSLRGAVEAAEAGIIIPVLVGPARKITDVARAHGLDIDRFERVEVPHSDAAAAKAVQLIHE